LISLSLMLHGAAELDEANSFPGQAGRRARSMLNRPVTHARIEFAPDLIAAGIIPGMQRVSCVQIRWLYRRPDRGMGARTATLPGKSTLCPAEIASSLAAQLTAWSGGSTYPQKRPLGQQAGTSPRSSISWPGRTEDITMHIQKKKKKKHTTDPASTTFDSRP
jgi:hypothetical protein